MNIYNRLKYEDCVMQTVCLYVSDGEKVCNV